MNNPTYRYWDPALNKFIFFKLNEVHGRLPVDCYNKVQVSIGIKDIGGNEIFEGDFIDFSIRGKDHGPDAELVEAAEVWYNEEDACFCFGKYKDPYDKYEWYYSFQDDIIRDTILIVNTRQL